MAIAHDVTNVLFVHDVSPDRRNRANSTLAWITAARRGGLTVGECLPMNVEYRCFAKGILVVIRRS